MGGFQELRRDLQAVLGARTNINIAQIEDYGGETFLSEELAIAILQRSKLAFQRCQLLSQSNDVPTNALQIFEILLQYLISEHVDYALELGLQSVPIPENRIQPEIHFFNVVHQCNAIVRLLEEQFNDSVLPLVTYACFFTCLIYLFYIAIQIEVFFFLVRHPNMPIVC